MNKTIWVWVTESFSALHQWSDCPIEEVSFLRNKHRHRFHVRVAIKVNHEDRDVEFLVFQGVVRDIVRIWEDKFLGSRSCEMIADDMRTYLEEKNYNGPMRIVVSEDNENGAEVEWS